MVLGGMFDIPPSTLNKLLSGRKYMGRAELEKYHEEMKRKGVDIPKRCETKVGGQKILEKPRPSMSTSTSTSTARSTDNVMPHD